MKKSMRQGRRRQPLSVHDPRRTPPAPPHLGPRGFKARAPGLSGKERGAGLGLRRLSPAWDALLRPRYSLAASAPNPRPCPQASAAKQNKLVQASCCATQSRVSRGRMRAADGRRLQSRRGRNQRAAQPKPKFGGSRSPARRSRECTSPRRTPCVAQSPHRASVLIILVLSLLAS